MPTFDKTQLFVIVTDWFDNPHENTIFTSLEEAEIAANEYNIKNGNWKNGNSRTASYGEVMNINDYIEHERDNAASNAIYR